MEELRDESEAPCTWRGKGGMGKAYLPEDSLKPKQEGSRR